MRSLFTDRRSAGRVLAEALSEFAYQPKTIVLGLPRGGMVIADVVAQALHLPLDAFTVRKLGVPGHEELAMGAIASGGTLILDEDTVQRAGIGPDAVACVVRNEARELQRREQAYRAGRPPLDVRGQTVILVDDGLATGATMRAAVEALKRAGGGRIIVAVPVGAPDTCRALREVADEVICATTPEPFFGVGMWYEDFAPTSDEEVQQIMAAAQSRAPAAEDAGSEIAAESHASLAQGGSS